MIQRSARASFTTTPPSLGLRHGVSSSSIHLSSFLSPCSKHYLNPLCNTQREQALLSLTCRTSLSHYLTGQFLLVFQNPDYTLALVLPLVLSVRVSSTDHQSCFEEKEKGAQVFTCLMFTSTEGLQKVFLARGYKVQCRQGPLPSCPPVQISSLRTESWLVSSSLYLLTCISHDD